MEARASNQRKITHIITHKRTYSFFIWCIEIHVANMETKFYPSCPHHTKGWAGQFRAKAMSILDSTFLPILKTVIIFNYET